MLILNIIFLLLITATSANKNETAGDDEPTCKCCVEDSFSKICDGTIFVGEWGEGIGCPIPENRLKDEIHCPLLPLHEAAGMGNLAKVKQLLASKRVDVNELDPWHKAPLHYAVEANQSKIVQILLDKGAKVDPIEPRLGTPLFCAIEDDLVEIIDILLKHGADANIHSKWSRGTPLHMMAMAGNVKVVKMLLAHGANIEARDGNMETPLHCSIESGRMEVVRLLLEHGANTSTRLGGRYGELTPLMFAVSTGHIGIVSLLLNFTSRAVVNAQDEEGATALSNAAYDNKTQIAALLLQHDADPDLADYKGNAPLHWAAQNGFIEIADNLLRHGAKMDRMNANGDAPLHTAIRHGQRQIVQLLIGKDKRNALLANSVGETPLELAIVNDRKEIAEDLVNAGAPIMPGNVEMAKAFNDLAIENILRKRNN